MEQLFLGRDVLDKQVVDARGDRMGRVDGILIELRADAPPRVAALAFGSVVLAARLHPWAVSVVRALRRWSVRRTARYVLPWRLVRAVDARDVEVEVDAASTPVDAWERWLLTHVVERLPALPPQSGSAAEAGKGKPLREER